MKGNIWHSLEIASLDMQYWIKCDNFIYHETYTYALSCNSLNNRLKDYNSAYNKLIRYCKTLEEAKQLAQQHFEEIVKSFIEEV